MDRALFLAMSGAKQNMQALQLRANNLANVSTAGFRADLAQARSMQAYGEGMPTRVFSMTERPGHNFAQGSVVTTGRDLDVTIQGDGWISVMDNTGREGLTRNGNLKVDQNGLLTNASGHLVSHYQSQSVKLKLVQTARSQSFLKALQLRNWRSLIVLNLYVQTIKVYLKIRMVYSVRKTQIRYTKQTQR